MSLLSTATFEPTDDDLAGLNEVRRYHGLTEVHVTHLSVAAWLSLCDEVDWCAEHDCPHEKEREV